VTGASPRKHPHRLQCCFVSHRLLSIGYGHFRDWRPR
jgi:hypothetical protein